MSRPELIIFDCDGVLVDSEVIAQEVLGEVLAALGHPIDRARVQALFFGKTVPQCIAIAEQLTGQTLSAEFRATWRDRLYREFRERPVRAVAGVEAVLQQLDLPVCIVSNGPVEKMQTTLGITGLARYFGDALFSPDCGLPGKPAPDLFLAAARQFAVAPQSCVVIEDSAGGIRGAQAAGMRALAFTGLAHIDVRALAATGAKSFATMAELPRLLESAGIAE